jgi:polar amino acid transport system substrate-binding protein
MGVYKKNDILLSILEKSLKTISNDTKTAIENKWINLQIVKKIDYKLIFEIVLVFLVIVMIILYWVNKLNKLNKLLKQQQEELKIAKQKAEDNAKAKEEFLSIMSHEIRTPITAIIGMSDLVLQTPLNNKQKEYIKIINSNSKKLVSIINNILDFAKLKKDKLELEVREVDLFSLINDIIDLFKFNANKKGLYINLHYKAPKIVNIDSNRLSQILINLIGNAIKFTPNGGIDIYVTQNKNIFRFEVKDTGIGIKDTTKLFEEFSQEDSSTARKYGGSGLGLSIVKKLVELMNGKIWIESQEGKGSNFIFEIKLDYKGDEIDSKIEVKQINIKNTKIDKDEKNILIELKEAIKTHQPKLIKPILEKLENHNNETIQKIVELTKKYKFKEVNEILEKI